MMTRELREFIGTLPEDVRRQAEGRRNKGALRVLAENGVQVPQDVLDAVEARSTAGMPHDELLDHMRGFSGNKPGDLPASEGSGR